MCIKHHPQTRRTMAVMLLAMLAGLALLPARTTRADAALENQVKSAFIFNFIQFIDWPDGTYAKPDDPIIIGVLENDPMEGALVAAVDGKTVKGRKLVVRHFAAANIGPCQVLYLGSPAADQAGAILKSLAGKNVTTIGDADTFIDNGGVIRFFVEERKVRFEINTAAADRAHLQISSKLLKLAKVVNK